jgi:hypothetical protein
VVVSGWKSGEFVPRRPVALGIRVGRANVERFFDKHWDVAVIEIENEAIPVKITGTFYTPASRSPFKSPRIADGGGRSSHHDFRIAIVGMLIFSADASSCN